MINCIPQIDIRQDRLAVPAFHLPAYAWPSIAMRSRRTARSVTRAVRRSLVRHCDGLCRPVPAVGGILPARRAVRCSDVRPFRNEKSFRLVRVHLNAKGFRFSFKVKLSLTLLFECGKGYGKKRFLD